MCIDSDRRTDTNSITVQEELDAWFEQHEPSRVAASIWRGEHEPSANMPEKACPILITMMTLE